MEWVFISNDGKKNESGEEKGLNGGGIKVF